jgi:hypothetical protein
MLESSLSKSIAAVENESTHAEARLAGAEKRMALTRKSIVVHEHVIRELKIAAAGLKNTEKLRGIADDEFLDKLESDAVFEIGLYTRANGVVRNSDINYGYLTNLN